EESKPRIDKKFPNTIQIDHDDEDGGDNDDDLKKNTDSLNTKITNLNEALSDNELDRDEGVALMGEKVEEKKAEEVKDIAGDEHVKGRQAEIYQIDMDHVAKVLKQSEMSLELLRFTRQQLQEGHPE
nr:hypothetical protein [Tanacetum cinerariifolium]